MLSSSSFHLNDPVIHCQGAVAADRHRLTAKGKSGQDQGRPGLADKTIKGANSRGLPIEQPTKFTLVVNFKTARSLGITLSESILLRADEVIR